jgi:hypothetical protein
MDLETMSQETTKQVNNKQFVLIGCAWWEVGAINNFLIGMAEGY